MAKRRSSEPTGESLVAVTMILLGVLAWQSWAQAAPNIRIAIGAGFAGSIVFMLFLIVRSRRLRRARQVKAEADERWRLSALSLLHLTPTQFEAEVAWAFEVNIDWCTAKAVGGAGDGGVDVLMLDSNGKVRGIVQCKHRKDPNSSIEPTVIRDMDSTRHRRNAEHAFVVTNARFSESSYAKGREYNIHLIDGRRFEQFRRKAYGKFYSQQTAIAPDDFPAVTLNDQAVPEPPALKQNASMPVALVAQPSKSADPIDIQLAERRKRLNSK